MKKIEKNQKSPRYPLLDIIRGFALLSMTAYHAAWDMVYLFGMDWKWYQSRGAYIWQQSICWTFILLSGFCYPLGRKKLKRGCTVFGAGLLVSVVTVLFMPENQILFGVFTLIGSCMLLMIPMEKLLKKCRTSVGLAVSVLLFGVTRNVNDGFLGFEMWNLFRLPESWYRSLGTAYLGFPMPGFYSTDYFSLIPWVFLFVSGYFLHLIFAERKWLHYLELWRLKPIEWLGRHSLWIYMLHQPMIYALLTVIYGS